MRKLLVICFLAGCGFVSAETEKGVGGKLYDLTTPGMLESALKKLKEKFKGKKKQNKPASVIAEPKPKSYPPKQETLTPPIDYKLDKGSKDKPTVDLAALKHKTYDGFPKPPILPAFSHYNNKLYVYGGFIQDYIGIKDAQSINKVWIFNYKTKGWTNIPVPYKYRQMNSITATENKIIIFGGQHLDPAKPENDQNPYVNEMLIYDQNNGKWSKQNIGTARGSHSATYVNGKIYIWGGQYTKDYKRSYGATHEPRPLEIYDPKTNKMITKKEYTSFLNGHWAVAINNILYFVGGSNGAETFPEAAPNITYLDLDEEEVDTIEAPLRCWSHLATVYDNKILIFGGYHPNARENHGLMTYLYDPETEAWKTAEFELNPEPYGRIGGGVSGKSLYALINDHNYSRIYRFKLKHIIKHLTDVETDEE